MKNLAIQKAFSKILIALFIALNLQSLPLSSLARFIPNWCLRADVIRGKKIAAIAPLLAKNQLLLQKIAPAQRPTLNTVHKNTYYILKNIASIIKLTPLAAHTGQCNTDIQTLHTNIHAFLQANPQQKDSRIHDLEAIETYLGSPYTNNILVPTITTIQQKINPAVKSFLSQPTSFLTKTKHALMVLSMVGIWTYIIYQKYGLTPPSCNWYSPYCWM